ncbi:PepSY-associated TM helix domain-containing protein [Alteromonas gilva]|uniref:PepSY-associated TM helix domain-containing protein n=1 Tax=Alteromonas gilva TaxID=2987522 RepID=A0ABT5L622_9ALTE|nr:PepSY-associated TM helix domain-containing protein [Alteromonas gilva]MDC8832495.1 PepSY-associated TM helix domain-containing protein [Alteromonas gilva]
MSLSSLAKKIRLPTKKRWLDWHSFVGVTTGMLLFVICWSGTFATVSMELDWLLNPAMRVAKHQATSDDMLAAYKVTQVAMPQAKILSIDKLASEYHPLTVTIITEQKAIQHVLVDPATAEIIDTLSFLTVSRFFRDFHMSLFGFYGIGKYVVCLFSVTLLASLISGLMFYKRWWRRFWEKPKGKEPRALWSSIHRLSGLWALWFVVIMGLTGLWYLFEQSRLDMLDGTFSYTDSIKTASIRLPPPQKGVELPLETLVSSALRAMPDLDVRNITPNRGGYTYITGQTDSVLVRDRSNKIYVDPTTSDVAYAQKASDLPAYWYWSNMADPIHFGNFGGWITKMLWVIFGLVMSFLSLSGTWMYVKRNAAKSSPAGARRMAVSVYTSLIVVCLTLIMAVIRIQMLGPEIEGVRHFPNIYMSVQIFLASWTLVTVAICFSWGLWLIKSSRRVKH